MSAIVDRSMIEVFLNGGIASGTSTFFATERLASISVLTTAMPSGVSAKVEVYAIENAWTAPGSD